MKLIPTLDNDLLLVSNSLLNLTQEPVERLENDEKVDCARGGC